MESSSSNTGFFQDLPELTNQFYDDVSVQRVLKCAYFVYSSYEQLSLNRS